MDGAEEEERWDYILNFFRTGQAHMGRFMPRLIILGEITDELLGSPLPGARGR